jgi:Raf kinase inhibitor-like YbhB/YbcL family protein
MELHSSSFDDDGTIDKKYGKKADNISPQLSWSGVPDGTASFVLTCVDLHPVARGYVHWVVTGIPGDVTELPENAAATGLPAGATESRAYAGPFPPSGTHDYEFTLFAVGAAADVPAKAPLDQILHAIDPHVLARAKLVGAFTKP